MVTFTKTLVGLTFVLGPLQAFCWGAKGHQIVGEIAQRELNPRATKALIKILGANFSLAKESTFPDEVRSNAGYDRFKPWHFVEIPPIENDAAIFGSTLPPLDSTTRLPRALRPEEEAVLPLVRELSKTIPHAFAAHAKDGNALTAIEATSSILIDRKASIEQKIFAIRYLVHLVGDIHQPLHVGNGKDLGGNNCLVTWKGQEMAHHNGATYPMSIHSVWDDEMMEMRQCRSASGPRPCEYLEYLSAIERENPLSKKEIKAIQKGSIYSWARESADLREGIYPVVKDTQGQPVIPVFRDQYGNVLSNRVVTPGRPYCKPMTPTGEAAAVLGSSDRLDLGDGSTYFREQRPLMESQIVKGGYRLGKLLNDLFARQ